MGDLLRASLLVLLVSVRLYVLSLAARTSSWESRPGDLHPEPLAEPDVNLSIHPAPIR